MKANASDLHYGFDVKIFSKLHERLGEYNLKEFQM